MLRASTFQRCGTDSGPHLREHAALPNPLGIAPAGVTMFPRSSCDAPHSTIHPRLTVFHHSGFVVRPNRVATHVLHDMVEPPHLVFDPRFQSLPHETLPPGISLFSRPWRSSKVAVALRLLPNLRPQFSCDILNLIGVSSNASLMTEGPSGWR